MRSKFLLLASAALILSSCTNEDQPANIAATDNTLEVSAYVQANTRAAIDKKTFAEGDILALYACKTTGEYPETYADNFMSNVQVTYSGGSWNYSPLMTWPSDENEHLSFTAFFPYQQGSTALTYPFTVSETIDKQTDPLWCTIRDAHINDRNGTAINGDADMASFEAKTGSLPLKFKHMLSKVNFFVKLDANYPDYTVTLNSLTLHNVYTTGTFQLANSLASGSWTDQSTPKNFKLFEEKEEATTLSDQSLDINSLLMIPQSLVRGISSSTDNNVYATIVYTHNLAEGGEKTVTKTVFLPNSWELNKMYNYTINLSLDTSTITIDPEILDWSEDNDPSHIFSDVPAEAVDMGLPSGKLWASYNYGASKPSETGRTFYYSAIPDFISTWGPGWSRPDRADWTELANNSTVQTEIIDDVKGWRVVSKVNGNSIFMPNPNYWCDYERSNTTNYYYYFSLSSFSVQYERYSAPSSYYPIRPIFTPSAN